MHQNANKKITKYWKTPHWFATKAYTQITSVYTLLTKLQNNLLSQARGHSLPKPDRTNKKNQHIMAIKYQ